MVSKIKVLIADDAGMRSRIAKLFESISDVVVVGQVSSAEEAVQQTKILQPDILLMDIHMPDLDGFTITEALATEVPLTGVILMGPQGGADDFRKAMLAGAKDYIMKPFPSDELLNAVRQVYVSAQKRRGGTSSNIGGGKIITVFSPRGGIGKTTLATNLACALAASGKQKIAIVDCNLQFGDVAVALNVSPKASIVDMVTDIEHLDESVLLRYMVPFNENILILPAPFQPEQAENITSQHLAAILKQLKRYYPFVIVDTAPNLNDLNLTVIDMSDLLLMLSSPDITTTKNVRLSLETLETLGYPQNKIVLVLNRANSKSSLSITEVEDTLHHKFGVSLPSDGELVVSSVNRGLPFVISNPNALISREVLNLARKIEANELNVPEKTMKSTNKYFFGKFRNIFGTSSGN